MLLIGLFALALMLVPALAHAEPITIALLGTAFVAANATAAAVITFAITTALSMAISFVASALLKPSSSGGGTVPGTSTTVIDNKVTVRQTAGPRRIIYGEARVGGTYAFMHSTDNNKYLHLVIMFAGHEVEGFTQFWVGDEAFVTYENRAAAAPGAYVIDSDGFIVDGQYADKVRVEFVRGTADQVALGSLVGESGGLWTENHRLRGIAYAYVRLEYDRVTFAGGVPNFTCVVKGKKLFDPRAGASGWSANPALCVADYLCDPVYGIGVDYATGIDATALAIAANACDEAVPVAAGGAEVRFGCHGSFTCNDQPQEVLGRLLGSMHGKAPFDGERWKIMAGVYYTPSLTFTDDDLRAGPKVQTLTSRRDRFNAVRGVYINPANFWQESDFPPVVDDAGAVLDGGQIWRDTVLPFTRSASMAQRIAKIDLLKGRQEIVARMPCKLSVWRCQAGDTILWTSERYGWTAKPFEVKSSRFSVDGGTLNIDLELVETDPALYDWATSEESTSDPAPNTDLPNPFSVGPPSNLQVDEEIYETAPGAGVRSRAFVNWTESLDKFVVAYQVEWRLGPSGAYTLMPRVEEGTYLRIDDLAAGAYFFRVKAINNIGHSSSYVTIEKTLTGNAVVPEDPENLIIVTSGAFGAAAFAILAWDLSPNESVRIGGHVEIRYTAATSGVTWAGATLLDTAPGNATSWTVPFLSGTYLVKFKSATGVYSANAASVVGTLATTPGFQIVSALPSTGNYDGRQVYLTTDKKLYTYRDPPAAWERTTAAADIAGQITTTQITDSAVSTPKLAAASVATANLIAGSVTSDVMAAGSVTAAKLSSTEVSALFASFGEMTAGTLTAVKVQTAASGVRTTMDGTRKMVWKTDPSYASRPYYRSLGLSEPEIVANLGGDDYFGYGRFLNYGGGHAIDGIGLGDAVTPDNTPDAQGVTGFGDFAGMSGIGTKLGGVFTGGTYDVYAASTGYGPFTGAHDALVPKDSPVEIGDLVRDVAVIATKSFSNTLLEVARTTVARDKRVLGVVVARRPLGDFGAPAAIIAPPATYEEAKRLSLAPAFAHLKETHDVVVVNALGEGMIRCVGTGGPIEMGDLITSSDVPGRGMRQEDDVIHSYTVSKARADAAFEGDEFRDVAGSYHGG